MKKGQIIAYSGNRGGSQGPHLHFEIRSTQGDINLNPFLFGLPIADNTPPVVQRLACYDRGISVYEQAPRIFPVRKNPLSGKSPAGGRAKDPGAVPGRGAAGSGLEHGAPGTDSGQASYVIAGGAGFKAAEGTAATQVAAATQDGGIITVPYSRISFAIGAFDTQSGSSNLNGIFEAILYDNERPVIGFRMDQISYENTRNINAHIDYRTRALAGPWLQHLSLLPGYPPPSVYQGFTVALPVAGRPGGSAVPLQDGVIDLGDGTMHRIRIVVRDAYANTSILRYEVQYKGEAAGYDLRAASLPGTGGARGSEKAGTAGVASAKKGGSSEVSKEGSSVPGGTDGAQGGGKRFFPGVLDGSESPDCAFYVGERSLYDTVHLNDVLSGLPGSAGSQAGGISAVHQIGEPYIPLLEPVLVRLRPLPADTSFDKGKVMMVRWIKGNKEVQRPEWQGGWASARFRSFGSFQLVEDTVPPVIVPIGIKDGAVLSKAVRIAFTVKDNLAVRKFRAELDGAWLCFSHDKALAYVYDFDEHCPSGHHVLSVTAEDMAGNVSTASYGFTR